MSTPKKDYYATLEVDRNASIDDIKKSYKKLAIKWHPDKNPDNREKAEAKFKEITEAYSILADEDKKSKYDQFGVCDGEAPNFESGFPDLAEMFEGSGFPFGGMFGNMFGNMGGDRRQQKQKPIQEVKVNLTLSEIFNGCDKKIDIEINGMCKDCSGTGSTDRSKPKCDKCKGKGVCMLVRQIGPGMVQQQAIPCDKCNQTGFCVDKNKMCQKCRGKGTQKDKLVKDINVKSNFDYQTKMCIRGMGSYDTETESNADIFIKFKIVGLDNYEVSNNYDVVTTHKINIYDALTGNDIFLDHFDNNKYYFKVDSVIKDGDIKYAKNLGLPYQENGSNLRGKLIFKFEYEYPNTLLDSESFKLFMRNKDKKKHNKDEYKREKLYDLKQNSHDSRDEEDDRQQSFGNSGHPGHPGFQGMSGGNPQQCPVQ
jgi:DnaJ family protein A protein 2